MEGVRRVELDRLEDGLAVASAEDDLELVQLAFVRRDDADLAREVVAAEVGRQPLVELERDVELGDVDEGVPLRRTLMLALNVEESIRTEDAVPMPRPLPEPAHAGAVEKFAVVEGLAGVSTDVGMHAILRVEEMDVVWMVRLHAHEQALLVQEASGLAREDRRRQLLRVSDEDALGAAVLQRDEGAQLDGLCGLVDDDRLELDAELLEHVVPAAAEGRADDVRAVQDLLLDSATVDVDVAGRARALVSQLVDLRADLRLLVLLDLPVALEAAGIATLGPRLLDPPPEQILRLGQRPALFHQFVDLLAVVRLLAVDALQSLSDQLVQRDVYDVGVDGVAPAQADDRDPLVLAVERPDPLLETHDQLVHGSVARSADEQLLGRQLTGRA